VAAALNWAVHPLDFGFSKGADFDFSLLRLPKLLATYTHPAPLSSCSKLTSLVSYAMTAAQSRILGSSELAIRRANPISSRFSRIPSPSASTLESTLAKVYQNKQLQLSLESTLTQNPGEGGGYC
jgi:hypothetical protein